MSAVELYGWEALPRDVSEVLQGRKSNRNPEPQTVAGIKLPETPLAQSVLKYAKQELNSGTYNHSMRVYYYGKAIQTEQFPDWRFSDETYLLACLLHDIGTTDKNISATKMSFEFYGGMLALDLLSKDLHAPTEQAESVAEAIIRHQDIGKLENNRSWAAYPTSYNIRYGVDSDAVSIPRKLTTGTDNIGGHKELVHKDTIEDVTRNYPRNKWSSCFAATIRKENDLKPWAHTTALGEDAFPNDVLNNKLMEPYD